MNLDHPGSHLGGIPVTPELAAPSVSFPTVATWALSPGLLLACAPALNTCGGLGQGSGTRKACGEALTTSGVLGGPSLARGTRLAPFVPQAAFMSPDFGRQPWPLQVDRRHGGAGRVPDAHTSLTMLAPGCPFPGLSPRVCSAHHVCGLLHVLLGLRLLPCELGLMGRTRGVMPRPAVPKSLPSGLTGEFRVGTVGCLTMTRGHGWTCCPRSSLRASQGSE